jgi:hypothetical protein
LDADRHGPAGKKGNHEFKSRVPRLAHLETSIRREGVI